MDFAVTTEVDRRAWAVEQAVRLACADARCDTGEPGIVACSLTGVSEAADSFLAYVSRPVAEDHSKLIDAARSYDGTVNAAALVGALADALERR